MCDTRVFNCTKVRNIKKLNKNSREKKYLYNKSATRVACGQGEMINNNSKVVS